MTPEQFDQEFGPEFAPNSTPTTNAYGTPVQAVKPGLTRRGKIAVTVAAVAIAGTGFFWYESHSAQVAKDAKETAALEIQMKELELEKLKELNKANAAQSKEKATEDAANQKFVDACIEADKGLVGKQMGVTYSSVVADCQDQFQTDHGKDVEGTDMAAAGSATDTGDGGGGVPLNQGVLVAVGALGLGVVVLVRKGTRSNAA